MINAFKVYILESPSPEDILNGVHEAETLYRTLKLGGIPVAEPVTAVTQETFRKALKMLINVLGMSDDRITIPILHISAHGSTDGIMLGASEKQMSWDQLAKDLCYLNHVTSGTLFVSMSSCFGYNGFKMARALDGSAFHTLIGPIAPITWSDMLTAYATFYHHMLHKGSDPATCIHAMNIAAGIPPDTFQLATSKNVKREFIAQTNAYLDATYGTIPQKA